MDKAARVVAVDHIPRTGPGPIREEVVQLAPVLDHPCRRWTSSGQHQITLGGPHKPKFVQSVTGIWTTWTTSISYSWLIYRFGTCRGRSEWERGSEETTRSTRSTRSTPFEGAKVTIGRRRRNWAGYLTVDRASRSPSDGSDPTQEEDRLGTAPASPAQSASPITGKPDA